MNTISDLQAKLEKGETTSEELTKDYLKAISANKDLNAFLYIDEEDALRRAKDADKRRTDGGKGPLLGIPYALKDNIVVEGQPVSAGSKILKEYTGTYNATVVKKLGGAGAVLLGKTNLDEFAMGSSTENSAYGVVKNPLDKERVPGGSSGGSAAAVAAGLSAFALGSDTGGSIRQPAALTGVVGVKPTYGRVSRYGLIALASSLDQIGPFTNSVEDAETVLSVISGADELDSTSSARAHGNTDWKDNLKGVKLGVPKNLSSEGLHDGVKGAFEREIETLRSLGANVTEVDLPHADAALAVYYVLMPVEAASNLSRYDGIRYGHSVEREGSEEHSAYDVYALSRAAGFGAEAKRRIMLGTYASSAGYFDAYYGRAQKVRTLVIRDFAEAFKKVDAIVMPTSPSPAFKIGEKSDPLSMYLEDVFTVTANIAGVPAVSIPMGEQVDGLPAGIQIITSHFEEARMFEIAGALEGAHNG